MAWVVSKLTGGCGQKHWELFWGQWSVNSWRGWGALGCTGRRDWFRIFIFPSHLHFHLHLHLGDRKSGNACPLLSLVMVSFPPGLEPSGGLGLRPNTSHYLSKTGKSGGSSRVLNLCFSTVKNKIQIDQPRLRTNYFYFKPLKIIT